MQGIVLHDFYSLLFDDFVHIVCKNDLTRLIISGEPTNEELVNRFNDILEQYSIVTTGKGGEFTRKDDIKRDIALCRAAHRRIYLLCVLLSVGYDERLANDAFDEMGIVIHDLPDRKEYLAQLQPFKGELAGIEFQIDSLERDYKELYGKEDKEGEVTPEYFRRLFIAIQDYKKYSMQAGTLLLCDFCLHIADLKKYHEELKKRELSNKV